jgi:hypothetical protein
VRCDRNQHFTEADTGVWNATLVHPEGSAFVNSPTNFGRYNIVDGRVHAVAAFSLDGAGRPVKTDFAGAVLALPVPAANNSSFSGTIIYVSSVPDGGKENGVVGRFEFQEETVARIRPNSVQIATNEDIAPTVRPCYHVWIKMTYNTQAQVCCRSYKKGYERCCKSGNKKCCKKTKNKYEVKIDCQPAHHDKSTSDAGQWNLSIIPDTVSSSFRPTPNEQTSGQFTTITGVVDNQGDFTSVGLGSATENDLFNTIYTLEQPAVANSVNGFSVYFLMQPGSGGNNYFKFIQNDISYASAHSARIHKTNIVETGSLASPATAEYEGWTFITHELL